jgi:hypothetical protein
MTVECSPDFFIYVPTVHAVETPSRLNQPGDEEVVSRQFNIPPDLSQEKWVKIPLEGELIIYARLRDEQLEGL